MPKVVKFQNKLVEIVSLATLRTHFKFVSLPTFQTNLSVWHHCHPILYQLWEGFVSS